MSRILKYLILAMSAFAIASCAQDPSVYDLKSPCVSNDDGIHGFAPCVKRRPLENDIA